MIVLDASVVVELLRGGPAAEAIEARLRAERGRVHAPELLDVEVLHVLRRLDRQGLVPAWEAPMLVERLRALPVRRHPHRPVLARAWSHRANLTAYDALYVSLAEGLGATLLTRDARVARAPGVQARVELVA